MSTALTVRFSEFERYDIATDAQVVRFLATTGKGSYFADAIIERASDLRLARTRFKERSVAYMQKGADPCEVDLGEYDD